MSDELNAFQHQVLPELSGEGRILSQPVGGDFGITSEVPDWEDVLDWQAGRRPLSQGYYRLVPPPMLQQVKQALERQYPERTAVLFCSAHQAMQELEDLFEVKGLSKAQLSCPEGMPADLGEGEGVVLNLGMGEIRAGAALLKDAELAQELHERNRRRGGSLSARNVATLWNLPIAPDFDPQAEAFCRTRLLELEGAEHAFFYPSGMAAVTAALDLVLSVAQPKMIVLGNVYRDSHLLLEEMHWAGRSVHCEFLDWNDLDGLREGLKDPEVSAVLVETVTNPLIEIPDLPAISACCREAECFLIVDSTMASPLNVQPLKLGADVVIHSTSKYLSGGNAHGGGVILCNHDEWAKGLFAAQRHLKNTLSPLEFAPLSEGLATFEERMHRFNANGQSVADLLRAHPAVESVYYGNHGVPEWLSGLGSVVSAVLKDRSMEALERFYRAELPGIIKAPSLGSNQTLFCPYVFLAYTDKSEEYLEACGLTTTLLRFAVGCEEDLSEILGGIQDALDGLDA